MSNIIYLYEYIPGSEAQSSEQQMIRDEIVSTNVMMEKQR